MRKSRTRTYRSWDAMKYRCYNKKHKRYADYGAKGITVCTRWKNSFDNFYLDMGKRPEGMTLDRVDNNGNYEPSNCKWSTQSEQSINRRPYGKSSYRGVCGIKDCKNWRAQITVNKKKIYLGLYATEKEAAKAYDRYVIEHNIERILNFKKEV